MFSDLLGKFDPVKAGRNLNAVVRKDIQSLVAELNVFFSAVLLIQVTSISILGLRESLKRASGFLGKLHGCLVRVVRDSHEVGVGEVQRLRTAVLPAVF